MTTRTRLFLAAGALAVLTVAGCSSSSPETLDQATATDIGTRLITEYYDTLDCEGQDVAAYGELLDPAFQSVTATGAKTKDEVLEVIGSVCFEDPTLSDIEVTAAPGVLIVSYRASLSSNGVAQTPTERVNVFVDEDGTWTGVTYADAGKPSS